MVSIRCVNRTTSMLIWWADSPDAWKKRRDQTTGGKHRAPRRGGGVNLLIRRGDRPRAGRRARAAPVEGAARRRVERRRQLALDGDALAPIRGVDRGRAGEERARIGV